MCVQPHTQDCDLPASRLPCSDVSHLAVCCWWLMACRFQQGKRHGQGVQVVRGAYQYTGAWQEDRRCGPGTCTYADGSVYEGDWCKDVYHGQGCFKGADGSAYEGGWVDGKQHGQGEAPPNAFWLHQIMHHAGCPHSM